MSIIEPLLLDSGCPIRQINYFFVLTITNSRINSIYLAANELYLFHAISYQAVTFICETISKACTQLTNSGQAKRVVE